MLDPGLIGGAAAALRLLQLCPVLHGWNYNFRVALVLDGGFCHPGTGLLLPVLGALPDALIIIVSGLGGTTAEAQEQVHTPEMDYRFAGSADI